MNEQIEVDIKVPNHTQYLSLIGRIGEDIAHTLEAHGGDQDELAYHINLVLTEAMTNAICHANENDPLKEVHIVIALQGAQLNIKVYDQGQGFDISDLPTPDFFGERDQGRGVFIIRSLMDQVDYYPTEDGHCLEMKKNLYPEGDNNTSSSS